MANQKKATQTGNDDIARGNVGTGDQNPGDVDPHGNVNRHTGEIERAPGNIKEKPRDRAKATRP